MGLNDRLSFSWKSSRTGLVRSAFIVCLTSFLLIAALAAPGSPAGEGPAEKATFSQDDWPWWRGPGRDGIAAPGQAPPIHWSGTQNILWSSPVPGQGHGSPTVVGNQVFLVSADYENEIQSVVSYDRSTGSLLWKTDVHKGNFTQGGHGKANLGATTVACDGERIFVNFLNGGAVHTTALSLEGTILWQTKISDFVIHQGFGSSPAIYESLVIVSADNKGGGAVAALDRVSGKIVWKQDRPQLPNYTSPIILRAAGRDQLILSGCDLVSSFDPLTGKKLWEVPGATTEVVTSVVTDGTLVFVSGGYPKRHVGAFHADGSGKLAWEKNVGVYVPSMLVRDGHIFLVTDNGVARCWKSATGEEIWLGRLEGTFSSSPVMVGKNIYVTNEEGKTFVFEANPAEFKLVAENQLGDHAMATPTIVGGRIYTRVGQRGPGGRQETLYCVADGN